MRLHGIIRTRLGCCLMAALAGLIAGCENNEEHIAPVDVHGLWTVVGIWSGKAEVEFQQDYKEVTALVAMPNIFYSFTGSMTADKLEGSFVNSSNAPPITIYATVSGNDMRGWWIISPEQGAFTATRK